MWDHIPEDERDLMASVFAIEDYRRAEQKAAKRTEENARCEWAKKDGCESSKIDPIANPYKNFDDTPSSAPKPYAVLDGDKARELLAKINDGPRGVEYDNFDHMLQDCSYYDVGHLDIL